MRWGVTVGSGAGGVRSPAGPSDEMSKKKDPRHMAGGGGREKGSLGGVV